MCLVSRRNLVFQVAIYWVCVFKDVFIWKLWTQLDFFFHEITYAVVCTLKLFPRLSPILVCLFFYPDAKPPAKANPCWWDNPRWWSILWNILNFYCKPQVSIYLNEKHKGFNAFENKDSSYSQFVSWLGFWTLCS